MQKIVPSLWFDGKAEEAAKFYVDIFANAPSPEGESRFLSAGTRYTDEENAKMAGLSVGDVMAVEFELSGQKFIGINGGPAFKFTEALSLLVSCRNQEEVDYFWEKLSAVPESEVCGWLKDKYGLSWQIIPTVLPEMMSDPDEEKARRVTNAMLKMKKIEIAELEEAYRG